MSINIQELTKFYGQQKALDEISFEVQKGEIIGFLGPNGAGKTTTMKIATGYLKPSSGSVEVLGYDSVENSLEVRRNIGYLPQDNPLYLDMYVKEFLRFVGKLHGLKGKRLTSSVNEMIDRCGLEREYKKRIVTLSGGYRQRVGLAQALIHDPAVLILDEPTVGLDPNQILEIRKLIQELGKEKTVIFSTHLMQEVQALCNRAVIINLGKIVADDQVESLKSQQTTQEKITLELDKNIEENFLTEIEGVEQVQSLGDGKYEIYSAKGTDLRAAISKLASEKGWVLLGMKKEEVSIEDVFRDLTK